MDFEGSVAKFFNDIGVLYCGIAYRYRLAGLLSFRGRRVEGAV